MNRLLIIGFLLSSIISCAGSPTQSSPAKSLYEDYIAGQNLEALPRINAFKFRGWRSLDNRHLIINTSPKKPYLITLQSACTELNYSHGIAINHSGTNILYTGSDSITVPGSPEQKCFIKAIYALTDQQADEIARLNKPDSSS